MRRLASWTIVVCLLVARAACIVDPNNKEEEPTVDETVDHVKSMANAVKDNYESLTKNLKAITEENARSCNQSNSQCTKAFSLRTYCCGHVCCDLYDYAKKDGSASFWKNMSAVYQEPRLEYIFLLVALPILVLLILVYLTCVCCRCFCRKKKPVPLYQYMARESKI